MAGHEAAGMPAFDWLLGGGDPTARGRAMTVLTAIDPDPGRLVWGPVPAQRD